MKKQVGSNSFSEESVGGVLGGQENVLDPDALTRLRGGFRNFT
jgi:hypothetical protein